MINQLFKASNQSPKLFRRQWINNVKKSRKRLHHNLLKQYRIFDITDSLQPYLATFSQPKSCDHMTALENRFINYVLWSFV